MTPQAKKMKSHDKGRPIHIPKWAQRPRDEAIPTDGRASIREIATSAYVGLALARREGATRIPECRSLMKKGLSALRRARDSKRLMRARQDAAQIADDAFYEALRLAQKIRAYWPLDELNGLALPHGWTAEMRFGARYRVAGHESIDCRVELLGDDRRGDGFFDETEPDRAKIVVMLPEPRAGGVPVLGLQRTLARIARALLRRGYSHPDRQPPAAASRYFVKSVASATALRKAAAELDKFMRENRRKTR